MVWNTIVSIITCRSVWSITILARFITQTNSDDTNPPSYFWKQYIYNGDRRPWAQIDEISQTGWGPLLKIMRKFACVKLVLQLWCENPISNLVWLGRNERQMMIFCWHSLNISILWSGYKSATNRITLKQQKTYRTIYNIWWQIGHFEHFSPPETLQVQIQSRRGWSRFLVSILYSETAIVLHVQCIVCTAHYNSKLLFSCPSSSTNPLHWFLFLLHWPAIPVFISPALHWKSFSVPLQLVHSVWSRFFFTDHILQRFYAIDLIIN